MEKEKFLAEARELIECCDSFHLSTFNKEFNSAETRSMANIRNIEKFPKNAELFEDGDLSNYIITALSTDKVNQLKDNPIVSIYYFCPKIRKSLTVFGTTEMIFDRLLKDKLWDEDWKYYFKLGSEDPEYSVIKFIPKVAKYFPDYHTKEMLEL